MRNSLNIAELHHLYTYLKDRLDELEFCNYSIDENGLYQLSMEILNGESTRKDLLIFAIKDMLEYIDKNEIKGIASTLMVSFKRIYC